MTYLTEDELLGRFAFYVSQLAKHLDNDAEFQAVADDIPVPVHLNDAKTLEVDRTNRRHEQLTGYSLEEIKSMGFEFLKACMHPASLASAPAILPRFYAQRDTSQNFQFIQLILARNVHHYQPVVTFAKPPEQREGNVVCISALPADFGRLSAKIERIIEMDAFKLKNFRRFQSLTKQEVQVLRLLANGCNNPQIAEHLFISRQTVETHRKRIKAKLDIKSYRELMKYALAFDLVIF